MLQETLWENISNVYHGFFFLQTLTYYHKSKYSNSFLTYASDISITVSTTNNMRHRFPPAGVCVKRDHELWRLVPYLDTTTSMSIYQPASSLQIKFCPFYQPLQSLLSQTLCKWWVINKTWRLRILLYSPNRSFHTQLQFMMLYTLLCGEWLTWTSGAYSLT